MKYIDLIENTPLVRQVDSCTTAGHLDYSGTTFEVSEPDGEEIFHVVVDLAGEQQVLFFERKGRVRMPLVLLEQIIAKAKDVVKPV